MIGVGVVAGAKRVRAGVDNNLIPLFLNF